MNQDLIIKANNLTKRYGSLEVIKGISLEVRKGEVISVVGPSGAGKSTLLNLIGCLDSFDQGELFLRGEKISNSSVEDLSSFRNKHLGFIFQQHNLLAEFTALENIMMPLFIRRYKKREARKKAIQLLEEFNLTNRINHKPAELSGGECQRIAVARAMIGQPEIILADEPTGSLDSQNSNSLIDALLRLGQAKKTTIIIVTHDQEIAVKTEKIISLLDGEIEKYKVN